MELDEILEADGGEVAAVFAEICAENGLLYVGSQPEAMRVLGDRLTARSLMRDAGLPLLPGSAGPVRTAAEARESADSAGYPVVFKAVAGTRGRGLTVVRSPDAVEKEYARARAAGQAEFGDDRVYVERYLERARRVEVHVLCDSYGNGVHLGARECTAAHGHRSLVEEAPASLLPSAALEEMCRAAVRGALAAGFTGAGTMQFLVGPARRYYFMEIDSREQTGHPVTEMTTGVDLLHQQLLVAGGEPLRIRQEDVVLRGVALECRVDTEDPGREPAAAGALEGLHMPAGPAAAGEPVTRVVTRGAAGYRASSSQDRLPAKVIVWAQDRELAIRRMQDALHEVEAQLGVRTTIPRLRSILAAARPGRAGDTPGVAS